MTKKTPKPKSSNKPKKPKTRTVYIGFNIQENEIADLDFFSTIFPWVKQDFDFVLPIVYTVSDVIRNPATILPEVTLSMRAESN